MSSDLIKGIALLVLTSLSVHWQMHPQWVNYACYFFSGGLIGMWAANPHKRARG